MRMRSNQQCNSRQHLLLVRPPSHRNRQLPPRWPLPHWPLLPTNRHTPCPLRLYLCLPITPLPPVLRPGSHSLSRLPTPTPPHLHLPLLLLLPLPPPLLLRLPHPHSQLAHLASPCQGNRVARHRINLCQRRHSLHHFPVHPPLQPPLLCLLSLCHHLLLLHTRPPLHLPNLRVLLARSETSSNTAHSSLPSFASLKPLHLRLLPQPPSLNPLRTKHFSPPQPLPLLLPPQHQQHQHLTTYWPHRQPLIVKHQPAQ